LLLLQIWPDILSRRALPAGRLAALGARRDFRHGLLAAKEPGWAYCSKTFALRCALCAGRRRFRSPRSARSRSAYGRVTTGNLSPVEIIRLNDPNLSIVLAAALQGNDVTLLQKDGTQ
jgi:hypothetical protein